MAPKSSTLKTEIENHRFCARRQALLLRARSSSSEGQQDAPQHADSRFHDLVPVSDSRGRHPPARTTESRSKACHIVGRRREARPMIRAAACWHRIEPAANARARGVLGDEILLLAHEVDQVSAANRIGAVLNQRGGRYSHVRDPQRTIRVVDDREPKRQRLTSGPFQLSDFHAYAAERPFRCGEWRGFLRCDLGDAGAVEAGGAALPAVADGGTVAGTDADGAYSFEQDIAIPSRRPVRQQARRSHKVTRSL